MSDITKATPSVDMIHIAGVISIAIGIISAIGVVLLIIMYILFATPQKELGFRVGMLNDICVALQYLLTIPVALALYPILKTYNPPLLNVATVTGIVAMLLVTGLQLLLIFKVLTFEQQVIWVSLAMVVGVGFWLIVSGLAARFTGKLDGSVLMSSLAVPYVGYPVWAIWLGLHLLKW